MYAHFISESHAILDLNSRKEISLAVRKTRYHLDILSSTMTYEINNFVFNIKKDKVALGVILHAN